MEAADARSVVEQLQRDAYFPIEVAPQRERLSMAGLARMGLRPRGVRGRDLVAFTQQLATLLEAGLPLDRALGIQEGLIASSRLRAIVEDVRKSVRGGTSLGEALAKHQPRPFSRLYVNMVRAGEKGGVLEQTLRRLAEFLEEAQEFRDALLSALIYPTLLAAVGGAADIFRDLGSAIPLPTQVLLGISAWIRTYWWALDGAALAVALTVRVWVASPRGRLQADRLLLSLPVLGPLTLE